MSINKQHYRAALEALKTFKYLALDRMKLFLTEKEFSRLNKKREFQNFIFAYNPYEYSEYKTYTILKKV